MKIQDEFSRDAVENYLNDINSVVSQAKEQCISSERIGRLDGLFNVFKTSYKAWYDYHAEGGENDLIDLIEARDSSRNSLIQFLKEFNGEVENAINNNVIRDLEELVDRLKDQSQKSREERHRIKDR